MWRVLPAGRVSKAGGDLSGHGGDAGGGGGGQGHAEQAGGCLTGVRALLAAIQAEGCALLTLTLNAGDWCAGGVGKRPGC